MRGGRGGLGWGLGGAWVRLGWVGVTGREGGGEGWEGACPMDDSLVPAQTSASGAALSS